MRAPQWRRGGIGRNGAGPARISACVTGRLDDPKDKRGRAVAGAPMRSLWRIPGGAAASLPRDGYRHRPCVRFPYAYP